MLRRSKPTRFSSASDDKVGGSLERSAARGSEQINRGRAPPLASPPCGGARFPTLAAGYELPAIKRPELEVIELAYAG